MLQLKDVKKSYTTGDFTQQALGGVTLDFRKSEFVAILGPSGSGKTTLLNIVGGLDRYDSGDLIINGRSTKTFKPTDWDAYRNNSVGFVFQSYNLIGHISVLKNVEMGMTLSGVSTQERKKRAMEALERVGIAEHAKKKPGQLSGGQAQRVAIARALANDPDIILADEPTGALDSETSVQIMELIREIAKDKLVVMVTHNGELAEQYASRIIKLRDGKVTSDSDPVKESETLENDYKLKKTAMHFFTALKLSFSNIMTKKGRTILTAFASSIGIIGIALILALSNGFNIKVEEFEQGTLSEYPVLITRQAMDMSTETMEEMQGQMSDNMSGLAGKAREQTDAQELYPYDSLMNTISHENDISQDYMAYLEAMDPDLVSSISCTLTTNFNLAARTEAGTKLFAGSSVNFTSLPRNLGEDGIFESNYDILAGEAPREMTDVLLVVDTKNRVDKNILEALSMDGDAERIAFEDVVGRELKLVLNDDYYTEMTEMPGIFTVNMDADALYDSENSLTLRICGVTRLQADSSMTILSDGLAYLPELADYVIGDSQQSAVVLAQREADHNVLSGEAFEDEQAKTQFLGYLGDGGSPYMVMVFPRDFEAKESVLEYLDAWNTGKNDAETVVYTDMAAMITELSGSIMDAITIVLVAFSAISLVVSVIMIAIITYISVIERTKEIGVLRALGARKKDVTRVFNAETTIIGLVSGLLGIGIAYILTIPANVIIENLSGLGGVALFNPLHAALLVLISLALTVLGGFIPAKMAARRDPVVALRAE